MGAKRLPMKQTNPFLYRVSQFISLLLGARIFVLIFFAFTLYVSTFFLFNQEESLRRFVFDYKVHGIIFCSLLSIAAGGIINQFYDQDKDRLQKPFRARIQRFLKQKYFLYSYIALSAISLCLAFMLSPRIFVFFLLYQFLIWLYSHKLSRWLVVNNFVFVALSLYPFFGLLVYYGYFSPLLFWMAAFLFLILLVVDLLKDILTIRVDKIFNYKTLPTEFGVKTASAVIIAVLLLTAAVSSVIVTIVPFFNYLLIYYALSTLVLILSVFPLLNLKLKKVFWLMNMLRLWIFLGVIFMLLNGLIEKF